MSTKKKEFVGFGLRVHTADYVYTVETTAPLARLRQIEQTKMCVILEDGIVTEVPYHAILRFEYRETQ